MVRLGYARPTYALEFQPRYSSGPRKWASDGGVLATAPRRVLAKDSCLDRPNWLGVGDRMTLSSYLFALSEAQT